MSKPAIIGGRSAFDKDKGIPMLRPLLPDPKGLFPKLRRVFRTGQITNASNVREFEVLAADYLNVKHCVAVSSCTSGLILVHKCLGLKGEVIVPSYTFHATVHSLLWNGITPVFADCREDTFNIDEKKIERLITKRTSAILAVYLYGNPPDMKQLERIAAKCGLKLIFDAAHAFGSGYKGFKAGRFGNAEIFSLSPTKLLISGEGGLVATNDKSLADRLRIARNYGDSGDYDCELNGLNARMTEFNAILGTEELKMVKKKVKFRNKIAGLYTDFFKDYDGVGFQKVEQANLSTFKDYSILIDPHVFGIDRDMLAIALEKENIMTRKYFYPPVHMQKAYSQYRRNELEVTERVSGRVLSLPIYSLLTDRMVEKICHAFDKIYRYRQDIRRVFKNGKRHK